MRNLLKSFAVIAVALSFVACQKEIEGSKDEPKVTHKVTFVAGNPETKTTATIDGSVVNYTWKDTDATKVGEVDKFHVFENGVEADGVLANLESDGTMTITAMFSGEYPVEGTIYTGYFNTGVQAVQEADGTDYDQLSDVLIARATAANAEGYIPFQFKRLGAICEMNIKGLTAGTNLKRVIVEATDENVFLAGSLVDGELVGNSKSIVINSLNEITSEVAKIRFVSLPVEGANLKVTVETTEDSETVSGTFYKKFGKAITFTEGDLKAFNVATAQVSKGDSWDYEFTESIFTAVNQTKTLSEKEWTVSGTGNTGNGYFQKDANGRGEQFGSNANPFTTLTFSSEDFGESYFVKDIRVTATSGATPVALSVSVGGVTLKNGENTSASLSTTENTYVFDADYLLSGKIELTFNQTASTKKAIYVHGIAVNYVARCEAPAANVESGSEVVGGSKIELSSTTEGASIYYTLDGEIPTVESSLYNNTDKVTMPNNDCTLKAIAVKDGMVNSTVAEFTYILPTVAKPTLSFKKGQIVATCGTDGAVIRYKIGGEDVADPTESDNVYDDNNKPSITANAYASIKAFKAGYHESQAVKAQYVAGAGIIDVIDIEAVTVGGVADKGTSAWVTDFDVDGTSSDAIYRIHTMGTNGSEIYALRFNGNAFLNTTTSGGVAKRITITGAAKTYSIYGGSTSFGTTKPSGTATGSLTVTDGTGSYEFTSDYEFIAIVGTQSSSDIGSITIEWGEPKADRDLAFFNGEDKVTAALNVTYDQEFTAPTLKDGETVISSGVTYSSNNEDVATVNETTGAVTIKKHGTAKITANVAADETHKAGSASYTINVAHVLSSISLADDSAQPTELYQNTVFTYTGIKVNANYNDECVEDITSKLTLSNFSGFNMANLGEQTVTVTYSGKTTSYTLNVVSAATLHNITYTGASDGKGNSVSGLAQAEEGDEVTLNITLASGYYLTALTVDGVDKMSDVSDNKVTFTMGDHDVAVVATFSNEYTVTFEPNPANGSITVNGSSTGSVRVAAGTDVNLVATPEDDGHAFTTWTVDPSQDFTSGSATSENATFKMPAQNVTVSGEFGVKVSTLTISAASVSEFAASYATYSWTADGVSGTMYAFMGGSQGSYNLQFNKTTQIHNTSAVPGKIKSITMTKAGGTTRSWSVYGGTSAFTATSAGTQIGSAQDVAESTTWNVPAGSSYSYFLITKSDGGTNIGEIVITYEPGEVPTPPSPTTLDVPTNLQSSNVAQTTATLSWNAVANASSYTVKIGETEYTNVNTNSYSATGLTADTPYTWTVKAIGDGVNYTSSDYASNAEFTTEEDTTGGGGNTPITITKTIAAMTTSTTNGTYVGTMTLDDNVAATANQVGNNGKVYSNGAQWRLYQQNSGKMTITAKNGYTLKSVTVTFSVDNTGKISYNGSALTSGTAMTVSGTSAEFVIGNTETATNGQVRVTEISVTYSK